LGILLLVIIEFAHPLIDALNAAIRLISFRPDLVT
jgi:hypothetical protein